MSLALEDKDCAACHSNKQSPMYFPRENKSDTDQTEVIEQVPSWPAKHQVQSNSRVK